MYKKNKVEIDGNTFDERFIEYTVTLGEVTLTFSCDVDGVLDSFQFEGVDLYLDAKDDIKLAYDGDFKTIQEIFDDTSGDAIDLHDQIMRENQNEAGIMGDALRLIRWR